MKASKLCKSFVIYHVRKRQNGDPRENVFAIHTPTFHLVKDTNVAIHTHTFHLVKGTNVAIHAFASASEKQCKCILILACLIIFFDEHKCTKKILECLTILPLVQMYAHSSMPEHLMISINV
jgi:hypothetical protein